MKQTTIYHTSGGFWPIDQFYSCYEDLNRPIKIFFVSLMMSKSNLLKNVCCWVHYTIENHSSYNMIFLPHLKPKNPFVFHGPVKSVRSDWMQIDETQRKEVESTTENKTNGVFKPVPKIPIKVATKSTITSPNTLKV